MSNPDSNMETQQLSGGMANPLNAPLVPMTSAASYSSDEEFVEERPAPINGMIFPQYDPPPNKPHRNTTQLQYILKILNRNLWKHHYAWPFQTPVDTIKLKLPDYFNIIKKPMDMGTIKKRLEHCWYYSAQECIADFRLMFNNCYLYNKPGEDVVLMAKKIEEHLDEKLALMPKEEIEVPMTSKSGKGKSKGKRTNSNSTKNKGESVGK